MDPLVIIGIGMLLGMLVVLKVDAMLWVSIVLSMFIAGMALMLTPNVGAIKWAITMISVTIYIVVLVGLLLGKGNRAKITPLALKLLPILLVIILIASVFNFHPKELIAASKNVFQFWSLPLVFYYLLKNEKTPGNMVVFMFFLAGLQPAIAGIQYFTSFGSAFVGDRVGGTFGGVLGGVGGNAELSMFMLTQILVVMSLIRYKKLKVSTGVLMCLWFMIPLLWTQAKAVVVFIPIGMFVLFFKDIKTRPLLFMGAMFITALITAGVTYTYYSSSGTYIKDSRYAPKTFSEFVDKSIAYNVINNKTDLNRTTAIIYWWDEHGFNKNNTVEMLIGHGLGAAKISGAVIGHLMYDRKYQGLSLGVTLLARLLWEVGLIGTVIYLYMFISVFFIAGTLAKDKIIPDFHRAVLSGYQAVMVILILSIPYKKALVNNQAFAAYSMFVVGYILFWYRYRDGLHVKDKNNNDK